MPRAVWAVTALWVALVVGYSLLLPLFRAPDEPGHVDLARLVGETGRYPAWDAHRRDPAIARAAAVLGNRPTGRVPLILPAPPRGERPALEDLRRPPMVTRADPLTQHPPLYYALAGGTVRAVRALAPGDPLRAFDAEGWALRLVSVALVAPLPIVTWRVARRAGLSRGLGVAASAVPLTVPQLAHVGSAVNNDDLFLLLTWLLTPVVLALAQGDLRARRALAAGALTGLALFTKGLALVLPMWVALAVAVGWWRVRRAAARPGQAAARPGQAAARPDQAAARPGQAALRVLAVAGGTALLCGGWWWIRNIVVYGRLTPSIEYERRPTRPGFTPDLGTFADAWAGRTTQSFWGAFGWGEATLPGWAVVGATAVVLVALACALRPRLPGTWLGAGERLVLVAPWVLLAGLTAGTAWTFYDRTGTMPLLQGRYWFGALSALAVLIVAGVGSLAGPRPARSGGAGAREARRWPRRALVALAGGGALLLHGLAVGEILPAYWGGRSASSADRLATWRAWAPAPLEAVAVAVALGAVALVAGPGSLGGRQRRAARTPTGALAAPIGMGGDLSEWVAMPTGGRAGVAARAGGPDGVQHERDGERQAREGGDGQRGPLRHPG
ncbi:MAG TPA: glycosyltransferase family 39 protein [Acidimicrobiales bacterium]|nr:glycosyltransferase family 39 protein [Acidimicrobiales bacterium]